LVLGKGNDTFIAKYTKKEVVLILENIPLEILAHDIVTHDSQMGKRLVIIAKKNL